MFFNALSGVPGDVCGKGEGFALHHTHTWVFTKVVSLNNDAPYAKTLQSHMFGIGTNHVLKMDTMQFQHGNIEME